MANVIHREVVVQPDGKIVLSACCGGEVVAG
jgi:hypothetical protein